MYLEMQVILLSSCSKLVYIIFQKASTPEVCSVHNPRFQSGEKEDIWNRNSVGVSSCKYIYKRRKLLRSSVLSPLIIPQINLGVTQR